MSDKNCTHTRASARPCDACALESARRVLLMRRREVAQLEVSVSVLENRLLKAAPLTPEQLRSVRRGVSAIEEENR